MRSRKDRRSERVPAVHRLMLTILSPAGAELLKEIIISVDVSKHGARVRGRRTLQPNWKGTLVQLSSGRQVPCRVSWQVKPTAEAEYFETGIEIMANFDFWGHAFSDGDLALAEATTLIENSSLPAEELLEELRKASAFQASESGNSPGGNFH